ncbi:MAG TPA: hypothetical protein VNO51_17790 [Ilumatobacteraceae bacterium]|nr:hypothetical protein [Ilumatobacteraceae bacterium]
MQQADEPTTPAIPAASGDSLDIGPVTTEFAERRCWRCLKMFPGDAPAGPSPTADFWLCDPCDASLIPQRAVRR